MKKIIYTILTVLVMGSFEKTQAQCNQCEAVETPNPKRSIGGVITFATSGTQKAIQWTGMVIDNINANAAAAGKTWRLTSSHIVAVLQKTSSDEVHLVAGTYKNSGYSTVDKKIEYGFLSATNFDGYAGVFEYDGVRVILFKWDCINVLQILSTTLPPPLQLPPPVTPKKDTVYIAPPKDTLVKEIPCCEVKQTQACTTCPQQQMYRPYQPMYRPIPIRNQTRVYVVNRYYGRPQQPQQPYIQPRTMPPGLAPTGPTTPPGVPASPRRMPGGLSPSGNYNNGQVPASPRGQPRLMMMGRRR